MDHDLTFLLLLIIIKKRTSTKKQESFSSALFVWKNMLLVDVNWLYFSHSSNHSGSKQRKKILYWHLFDLETRLHKPDNKPNDTPTYTHVQFNHPLPQWKTFQTGFPKDLSMLSSNKEIFEEAQGEYDDHLKVKWVKGTNGILGTILPCFWQFQCKNYLLIWP